MGVLGRIAKSVFGRNCYHHHHHQLKLNNVVEFTSSNSGRGTAAQASYSTSPSKRRTKKAKNEPNPKYIIDDFAEMGDADPNDRKQSSFLASPLLHIFSIYVNTNIHVRRPWKLYGSIRATSTVGEDNTSFNIYDRDHDNPETILKSGGNLSLIGPTQLSNMTSYIGNTTTNLDFNLKDKTRNTELIKAQLNLSSNTDGEEMNDSFNKLKHALVEGENGFASVLYATFQFAVYALVEVAILAKYNVSRSFSEIYGSIVAGYSNSKSHTLGDEQMKHMKSTLFNKSAQESVRATIDTPISLSRCVVVVPAFASLKIEAKLWDSQDGHFASGFVEFLSPCSYSESTKLILGEGGSVVVAVKWDNAFDQAYKREEQIYIDAQAKMANDQAVPSSSTSSLSCNLLYGNPLIEMFSIFVDSQAKDISSLCGFVGITDICERHNMYDRDLSDPDFLSVDKRIISLKGDHPISNATNYFGIVQYLKDPVLDLEISNGGMNWLRRSILYDKRVCAVLKGVHGYAAIHYATFSDACVAYMEITLLSSGSPTTLSSANIYGSVFARYSCYDYSSVYDKKYYQSRLFDKPKVDAQELTAHSNKINLLKSVVVVPYAEFLIVEAKLWAIPSSCRHGDSTKEAEALFGIVEFDAIDDKTPPMVSKKIHGERYHIQISANFSNY